METYKQAYIAIDLHSDSSTIGYMNKEGKYIAQQQFKTEAVNLINQVSAIAAERKHLTIEQGNMTFWAAELLSGHVDELIVCDPRHNRLITQSANKNDRLDTHRLCKLFRMGELKEVWRPKQLGLRRVFYGQIKHYQRVTKTLTTYKNRLQAVLRHWGINAKLTPSDYRDPGTILEELARPLLADELAGRFGFIRQLQTLKDHQFKRITETGREFWEIAEFQKMPGVGPVCAHTFSGYLQTPHRFRRREQLIRFCQLGIRKRSSDGRQLRAERLDKAGHSSLKNVSHTIWKAAQKTDNEVRRFYQASLERTGKPVNARLNTQRKILTTLWSIWKHKRTYRPEKFFSGDGDSAR